MSEQAGLAAEGIDPVKAEQSDASGTPLRVTATPAALELIEELKSEYGPVMFHQSGGCCDGSSPMCYPVGDFITSDGDVHLGQIGGADFFISRSQFEVWKHTHIMLDVVPGRGGMFSLENGREKRFHIRSRLFTSAENEALAGACRL
ncbi:Acetaldehyde dehydrogenase [Methylorubrum populi]